MDSYTAIYPNIYSNCGGHYFLLLVTGSGVRLNLCQVRRKREYMYYSTSTPYTTFWTTEYTLYSIQYCLVQNFEYNDTMMHYL